MNGTEKLTAILIITVMVVGGWFFKMWLSCQSREEQMAFKARGNEQKTERCRVIACIAKRAAQAAPKTWLMKSDLLRLFSAS